MYKVLNADKKVIATSYLYTTVVQWIESHPLEAVYLVHPDGFCYNL